MRMPAASAARARRSRSGLPSGSVASKSMPANFRECFGDREPLRFGERIGDAAAETKFLRPRRFRRLRQQCRAVLHQHLIRLAGAIPFDHCEFRVMQRAAARGCETLWRTRRYAARRLPTVSCRRIPATCADRAATSRRPAPPARLRKRANGSRCPAISASAPVSTSIKPSAANQARSAATIRPRAKSAGRRSAWTWRAQKGDEPGGSEGIALSAGL